MMAPVLNVQKTPKDCTDVRFQDLGRLFVAPRRIKPEPVDFFGFTAISSMRT
jgi:hypothetical protein